MSNITVAGITPDLIVLGDYQRFIYDSADPIIKLQTYGQFVPTGLADSVINIESRNNLLSGFRWVHTSTTTDANAFGTLKLQSFVSDGAGTDIIGFDGTNLNFNYTSYGNKPCGLLSWSANTTNTPISVADTFVKALGTTTLSSSSKCSTVSGDNRLIFTPDFGTQTISVLAKATLSFKWAGAGTPILSVAINKNSTQQVPIASITSVAAGNLYSLSVECLISMTNADYLEVWVTSSVTDATGLTIVDGSLSFQSV